MNVLTRRSLIALAALGLAFPAQAQARVKIVIVGGGFGGATAARRLRRLLPAAEVTLVEASREYYACPFSNLVLDGSRALSAQRFEYGRLRSEDINFANDRAVDVDAAKRIVRLEGGQDLPYDKLVLAPGIDIRWDALEGYIEAASEHMPHAWKAGPQTELLRRQLEAMEDGGTVVISAPAAHYRCPPGPYERASLIAHYLKTQKPRSKLIVLDSKDSFSKQPLFEEAWAAMYPDHLEWRAGSFDGRVSSVDANAMTVSTDFETINAAVANIIPPQMAGEIARRAGVADATGWCPVDGRDFSSALQDNIYVIGDATIAVPMPKSAFSAHIQAQICAISIARELAGLEPEPTILANTCYSYTAPDAAVSIVGVYSNEGGSITSIEGAGGLSPLGADESVRAAEAAQARDWFAAVTQEAFG